jgi:hypothetical protein
MTKTNLVTLRTEIFVACCKHGMEHINTLRGKNIESNYVQLGGMQTYRCALKD